MAGPGGAAPLAVTAASTHQHLDGFIAGNGLDIAVQPIVDVRARRIAGYEALSRFRAHGAPDHPPDVWFRLADDHGVGDQLEATAVRAALGHRRRLPRNCFLSINVDPVHLASPAVLDAFRSATDLVGVAVEFTEHRAWHLEEVAASVEELRAAGAIIAIDDAGAGHSGLRQILDLRPSILKLDRSLVAGIDRDESKVAVVEMVGVLANRLDAWVLAEGVETAAEACRIDELHVPLAQGWYFGRPAAPWPRLADEAIAALGPKCEQRRPTLHRLVDAVAPVPQDDDDPASWIDHVDPWRAVIDTDRRPLGLIDAGAAAAGRLHDTLMANVHSSPREVAQRLTTATTEPGRPVIVTDDSGRYLGLVTVRRLLQLLAGDG